MNLVRKQKRDLLIILQAEVSWTGNQHDSDILQRAFDDVHVLIQVAGWRLGGVRQEGILKVHAQGLREVMVPKCQTTLQDSKRRFRRLEPCLTSLNPSGKSVQTVISLKYSQC